MIKHRSMTAMVIISALFFSVTIAATHIPDRLAIAQNNVAEAGTQSGGLSLSSLNALLEGGNSALTADTLPNAAGVIEYCITNKLSDPQTADEIHLQLMRRLDQQPTRYSSQLEGYLQGKNGLLNTFSGQQLDMSKLGGSHLAQQMKTNACDLILRQGKFFTL